MKQNGKEIARGKVWSKKYKKHFEWWIQEYYNGKYQLVLCAELMPNETKYSSKGLTWKMMRVFISEMLKHYPKTEVEKELVIKIK